MPDRDAATRLPNLARRPGEYDKSYRERQFIMLGASDKDSPSEWAWRAEREAKGHCACRHCWRSELHRRGRVIEFGPSGVKP